MAWTQHDLPDQHGRVVVVTGGNGGLGLAVSRVLAAHGARVLLAARDSPKSHGAIQAILQTAPGADVELHPLDLADLDAVHRCADVMLAKHERIDLLVNNAGIMGLPERTTADGFESQFGVNHLGHFVLTRRLLPALVGAGRARVVTVTSFARLAARGIDADDATLFGSYDPWLAYGRSKLANLLFALDLHRRLMASGSTVDSVAVHPGLSATDLQARGVRETGGGASQRFWHFAGRLIGASPDKAAATILRAGTDATVPGGSLIGPRWTLRGAPLRRPLLRSPSVAVMDRLWKSSERDTGPFDVAAIVAGLR